MRRLFLGGRLGSMLKRCLTVGILLNMALFPVFVALAKTSNDPLLNDHQSYLSQVQVLEAWDVTTGKRVVVVAVLDAGVDIFHPDLLGNIWVNTDEVGRDGIDNDHNGYIDDVNGYDFVAHSGDPRPKVEDVFRFSEAGLQHGTVIAGLIGAVGNNHEGIAGVSWDVRIMPLRVLNARGEGEASTVVDSIQYAMDNGADIINMSFVGYERDPLLDAVIQRAYEKGIIIVAAAGNGIIPRQGGVDLDVIPAYPACSLIQQDKNLVLAVAALDARDMLTKFSNYGNRCIDLSAPGVGMFSTQTVDLNLGLSVPYGDSQWSGTSFAAPLVSGAAALMLSMNSSLTNAEVMELLVKTGDDIGAANAGFEKDVGMKLNVKTAVQAVMKLLGGDEASPLGVKLRQEGGGKDALMSNRFAVFSRTSDGTGLYFFTVDGLLGKILKSDFLAVPLASELLVGDVSGDGKDEYIVFGGENGNTVSVFDSTGKRLRDIQAYDTEAVNFVGAALGDVDGDRVNEIITAPRSKGSPLVRVFRGDGTEVSEFLAYPQFNIGVHVAAGDVNNDGKDEIIVGAGAGGGPQVNIFTAEGKVLQRFFVGNEALRRGVLVASGNMDGEGGDEVVTIPLGEAVITIKTWKIALGGVAEKSHIVHDQVTSPFLRVGAFDFDVQEDIIVSWEETGSFQTVVWDISSEVIRSFSGRSLGVHGGGPSFPLQ